MYINTYKESKIHSEFGKRNSWNCILSDALLKKRITNITCTMLLQKLYNVDQILTGLLREDVNEFKIIYPHGYNYQLKWTACNFII
jgi:hypothetical protein